MGNNIKISVVVPAYNVEQYLAYCLDSILNQSLRELEIIIVNDCSTDNTLEIAQRYKNNYQDKIKLINKDCNEGLAEARNTGLRHIEGEYVAFVDSDDWIDPDMYMIMYEEAKKGYDMVICDYIRTFSPDSNDKELRRSYWGYHPLKTEEFIKFSYRNCVVWNKLYSADLLKKLKFKMPPIRHEDVGWTPAVISWADKIKYISAALYFYRINPDSITSNQNTNLGTLDYNTAFDHSLKNAEESYKDLLLYSAVERLLVSLEDSSYSNFKYLFYSYLKKLLPLNNKLLYKYGLRKAGSFKTFLSLDLIPNVIYVMAIGREIVNANRYKERLTQLGCGDFEVKFVTEESFEITGDLLNRACEVKNYDFVNDYAKCVILYKHGGIVIDPCIDINLGFANILWHTTVFGTVAPGVLHTHVMASKPFCAMFIDLLTTYEKNTFQDEFLPLNLRIADYIKVIAKSNIEGIVQEMPHLNLRIEGPCVFLYTLSKEENYFSIQKNHELEKIYRQKSIDELLRYRFNKAQYKKEISKLQSKIKEIENSTSWKLTSPIRRIVEILRKIKKRAGV